MLVSLAQVYAILAILLHYCIYIMHYVDEYMQGFIQRVGDPGISPPKPRIENLQSIQHVYSTNLVYIQLLGMW